MKSVVIFYRHLLLVLSLTLAASGCATYSSKMQDLYSHLEQQQAPLALAALEKNPGPQRDRLAYLLNHAMLLRMNGQYQASSAELELAKLLIDELDAISLREQAGALSINETLRSYGGEPHEHILVHLYAALNYLQLGQLDSARVEALQVNVRLQRFAEDYDDEPDVYSEDAFARYLTGMIYEALGEWSDAMIAYRAAYEAYQRYAKALSTPVPPQLKQDLLRLSDKMGLTDELAKYKKSFAIDTFQTSRELQQQGELIILLHNGLAPKKDQFVDRVVDVGSGRLVSIALPLYLSTNHHAASVNLQTPQQQSFAMVENVDAIAKQTLANQMAALTVRAIARAIVKDNAARRTEERNGPLAGFLVNIAAAATEVADTRSWWTLPHDIQLLRLPLAAGQYDIQLNLIDNNGSVIDRVILNNITLTQGKKTWLEHYWIRPHLAQQENKR